MTRVLRAADRFHSVQPGIESWHCFSAGAHYDPDNTGLGPLIGFDVHVVAPGAGFDWHGHRGIDIVSWVQDGVLHHEDDAGAGVDVRPGTVLIQHTGAGIRHRETNGGATPLTLVQMSLLDSDASGIRTGDPPMEIGAARFEVWSTTMSTDASRWHGYVVTGSWHVDEFTLTQGDSVRGAGRLRAAGTGVLLVWLLP